MKGGYCVVGLPAGLRGKTSSGEIKKARLRQARRLLIVPFKTKIFANAFICEATLILEDQAKKKRCYYDYQMNTG